jgi:hypothetical protein
MRPENKEIGLIVGILTKIDDGFYLHASLELRE